MDKDSRVLWKYLQHAHHDADVGPDGRVYALVNEIATDRIDGFPQLRPPRIDDSVVVLSPDGRELKRVKLLQAMLRSPYARLLTTVPWYTTSDNGDYLHTNTVDVLDGTRAGKLPEAEAGRVLLSFREINTIAILDLEREEIVWGAQGPWLRQHDPDLLVDGDILLFDNQGNVGPGGITRLIEFDPVSRRIEWAYGGTAQERFESEVRSSQERLANGNTLITESDGGRLFEVTPAGEVVWSYLNPVRGGTAGELIPIVAWGQRIDPDALADDFRQQVLAPGVASKQRPPHPPATTAG
jgi:outer membrane protein assembly factor BamB